MATKITISVKSIGATIFTEDLKTGATKVKSITSNTELVDYVSKNVDCFSFHAFCSEKRFASFSKLLAAFGFEFNIDSKNPNEDTDAFDFFGFATV